MHFFPLFFFLFQILFKAAVALCCGQRPTLERKGLDLWQGLFPVLSGGGGRWSSRLVAERRVGLRTLALAGAGAGEPPRQRL